LEEGGDGRREAPVSASAATAQDTRGEAAEERGGATKHLDGDATREREREREVNVRTYWAGAGGEGCVGFARASFTVQLPWPRDNLHIEGLKILRKGRLMKEDTLIFYAHLNQKRM
jgi:hypothetical protein